MLRVDTSALERALDDLEAHYRDKARRGLAAGASDMRASMRATSAYRDDTGATRAGTTAYVVEPGNDGSTALAAAVGAVEAENPGHSATARGRIGGDMGVVATIPTDYQAYLEGARAGQNAVLAPALAVFADELTARAAEGR